MDEYNDSKMIDIIRQAEFYNEVIEQELRKTKKTKKKKNKQRDKKK